MTLLNLWDCSKKFKQILYSEAGTKLGERVYDGEGVEICRRDYAGVFEFEGDTLERMLVPEGFVTASDSTLHIFIPDYQGNITGVYNSARNCLEQFTDYYPYGMPHASATSPSVNRRKYGGKELTTDCGLNLCDFSARWHNPAFPTFTTPDPLAELKSRNSNYGFCGGDPVNFIDPTGLHEYEYDKDGYLRNIVQNEDFDALYIVDADGNRIHESDHFPFETINYKAADAEVGIPGYLEIINVRYTDKAFEFLASHTNVEWGGVGYFLNGSKAEEIISTSNMPDTEKSIITILNKKYRFGSNTTDINHFYYHIHSHPSNNPQPSGMYVHLGMKEGDIQIAAFFEQLGFSPLMRIFLPAYNVYITFDKDSTHSSLYYGDKEYRRIYNEIIKSINNK